MPADHLTTTDRRPVDIADLEPATDDPGTGRMTGLVEAVLAGAPIDTTAAAARIDPTELRAALTAYCAAGRAALRHQDPHDVWFHASVRPVDWTAAEEAVAEHVAPRLDRLDNGDARWWFLRKHPDWRIRIRTTDHDEAAATLDRLTGDGAIRGWTRGVYEPEAAAFGGPAAMDVVHDLFCADSRGILIHTRQEPPPIGRRELSLLLIRTLHHHAGLDWFETADVFARVARLRPAPAAGDRAGIDRLADHARTLLALGDDAHAALFESGGRLQHATGWWHAHHHTGQQLTAIAASGQLDRGLRAVLAHIVIFHWNRLGLSARTQAVLAHAATSAILRADD